MKNYLVQPKMFVKKEADYKEQEYIQSVFEIFNGVDKSFVYISGNLELQSSVDKKKKTISFEEIGSIINKKLSHEKNHVEFYESISAALLLYRIICLFPSSTLNFDGSDGDKMTFEIFLKHKETGEFVGFGDYKGSASIRGMNKELYQKKTLDDFIRLINLILSNQSPHPYGIVSGSAG